MSAISHLHPGTGPSAPSALLVGEANPYGDDPEYALFPLPERASGGRLQRILGLMRHSYMESLDRCNLCPTDWSMREALVLLGGKVASAFSRHFELLGVLRPWQSEHVRARIWCDDAGVERCEVLPVPFTVVALPHPSGLNRAWSDPGAVERSRAAVSQAAPWLPIAEDAGARP